eukprot:8733258-Ditylum_brightwellii.AAC.1
MEVSKDGKFSIIPPPSENKENVCQSIQPDDANKTPSLESVSLQDEIEVPLLTPQSELLRWHYHLGYLSC